MRRRLFVAALFVALTGTALAEKGWLRLAPVHHAERSRATVAPAIDETDARLDKATVASMRLPMRGWHDHDWVLVVDGAQRRYVDPTLADIGLGWDVSGEVVDGASITPR